MLHRFSRLSLVLCFGFLAALPAETVPTYVVTASSEKEDIMAVPSSVTVVTAGDIAESGATSIVAVLEKVVGVTFRSYSTEADAQVSMRGFGENSCGRVLVLVDGRELNNPDMAGLNWQSIPLSSIERIEVLDGPGSVVYGSGAVGGVINIITRESVPGVSAGATISGGSFGRRQYRVNGGYGADRAGIRVAADYFATDGYRSRSASENTNVTVSAFVDLSDRLTLKPSFSYADLYYEMPGSLSLAMFESDPTQALNRADSGTEKDLGGNLSAVYEAGDRLSVEFPLTYLHKDRSADNTAWSFWTDREQHQFGARPKASWNGRTFLGDLRITGGLEFDGTLYGARSYSDSGRTVRSYSFDISQYSGAPWLSATTGLPYGFRLTGGLRYDLAAIRAEKEESGIDATDSYSALVWDAALNWQALRGLSAYARYNTLFRYPFIDEKAELTGMGDRFNEDLVPETGYNVEVGWKFMPARTLSVGMNAYFMSMKNEIVYTSHNVNLDRTCRTGGNLSFQCIPARWIELSGSCSSVEAVFAAGDNKGSEVPLVPGLTASGNARIKLPLGITAGAGISYTGDSRYLDEYAGFDETVDPFYLVSLEASWTPPALGGHLSAAVSVDNLLDSSYAPYYATGYDSSFTPYIACYPAEGRSVTVSVSCTY